MVSPFSSELHFHILFSFLLKAPKRSAYCLGLLHRDIQTAQTHMLCHCKMNTPSWRSKTKNAETITLGTWYHPPIKQECNEKFSFQCQIHLKMTNVPLLHWIFLQSFTFHTSVPTKKKQIACTPCSLNDTCTDLLKSKRCAQVSSITCG